MVSRDFAHEHLLGSVSSRLPISSPFLTWIIKGGQRNLALQLAVFLLGFVAEPMILQPA